MIANKNNMMTSQILRMHCPYLDVLEDESLDEMIDLSNELVVTAGEQVLSTDHSVDYAYLVLQGSVASVFTRDWGEERILDQLGPGELLAEAELLDGGEYRSDISALEDSRLLCVPRQHFIALATKYTELWQYLSENARKRTSRLLITKYLSDLFGTSQLKITEPLLRLKAEEEWLDFEYEVLDSLMDTAEWIKLKRGDYLFHQGDAPDGAYIIASGVLRVSVKQEGEKEREIGRVRQGEIVGELALIADDNRSASIEALRECELFRLAPELLTHVAEKYPRVMLNIYRILSRRFRRSTFNESYRPRKSNIALLPIDDNGVLSDFLEKLYATMSELDSIEYLDSQSVDVQLGRSGIANIKRSDHDSIRLMQWLNAKELKSRYIVYRADDEWSHWTKRCVHQADMVMILSDASSMPEFAALKQHLEASGQSWSLIMLHPEDVERPRDTAKWRIESGASNVYHVRRENADDINRIARILTGKALSLVLGGGGARGFAHIGALRALEEMGVKVDMVSGTSMGAPIAALIAQGKNSEQCQTLSYKGFHKLFDYTLPATSVLQAKRISQSIVKQTASWDIEDFWLPFFCVSTNLTTASQMIHRTGNSASAIRASVSIPGFMPPVPKNGEFLVDGGVLNNLPIDVMRELNESGTILALDVVSPHGPTAREDYGLSLSGWRQLFRRLNPWQKPHKAPGIGTILMLSMTLGSGLLRKQILHRKLADFYHNIHVKGVRMMEFDAVDRAAKIGYESYIGPLQEWLQLNDIHQKHSVMNQKKNK